MTPAAVDRKRVWRRRKVALGQVAEIVERVGRGDVLARRGGRKGWTLLLLSGYHKGRSPCRRY
jgi:hypothetical protein